MLIEGSNIAHYAIKIQLEIIGIWPKILELATAYLGDQLRSCYKCCLEKCYQKSCQKLLLNHNSIQPQSNITSVGLDKKMTLHATTPQKPNVSNILAVTDKNRFLGTSRTDSYIFSFTKIIFDQQFFWPTIFLDQNLLTKKFFWTKFFWPKFFWPTILLTKYIFLIKNFFWPKILFDQIFFTKNSVHQHFFLPTFFLTNFCWTKKNF